jgi:hypothetical protein
LSNVGAMTNMVMKSASVIRIMFPGVVCSPRPARKKEKAIANRAKQVTIIRSPGATERTVIATANCTMRPLVAALPDGMRASRLEPCASADTGQTIASTINTRVNDRIADAIIRPPAK